MDRAELRRLAEAVMAAKEDFENNKFYDGCGYYSDRYAEAKYQFELAANPSTIIELLDEIEKLKCCGNCKHQTYDGMDYGCELVLKNYHQNKCDKWQGVE